MVLIPFPQGGQYTIKATPKPGALPTDTFTITMTQNGVTTTIADHVMIQNIPTSGYTSHVNSRPFASAGRDQTVECSGPGGTSVILNGSASGDQDGDNLTYAWADSQANVVGNKAIVKVSAAMGTQTYTLTVTDPSGLSATAQTHITVRDTTPPKLRVTLSPKTLWPPDKRLVQVTAAIHVSDICDASPTVTLISITSNDRDDDPTDIQGAIPGTDDRTFLLRARVGEKDRDRIYTVIYRASDRSGNSTTASARVGVSRERDRDEASTKRGW